MSQYSWPNCPEPVRIQVVSVLNTLQQILGESLIGVYLHGSLAMGCFNPARSDIDLLALSSIGLNVGIKRQLAEALLQLSNNPQPVEISILAESNLYPWEYPTPFEFHYGERWREKYAQDIASGAWQEWNVQAAWNEDLAAHLMETHQRGICLYGEPIALALPRVPARDYADSIVSDLWWARDQLLEDPVKHAPYFVLNACRVYAYLLQGYVVSKDEGALWALNVLPDALKPVVWQALRFYRSSGPPRPFDEQTLHEFIDYIEAHILELTR